jgi:adenosylcobyric acid synthase
MGLTERVEGAAVFAELTRDSSEIVCDGAVNETANVCGTYAHGLFSGDEMRAAFLRAARERCGLMPAPTFTRYGAEREARFDRLAAHVRASLDITTLLGAAVAR